MSQGTSTGTTVGLVSLLALAAFGCEPALAVDQPETPKKSYRVVIVIAEGYQEHEFWFPYYRFREDGADVVVAGPETGTVYGAGLHGKDGLPAVVTDTIEEVAQRPFDLLYLPGGLWAATYTPRSPADAEPGAQGLEREEDRGCNWPCSLDTDLGLPG